MSQRNTSANKSKVNKSKERVLQKKQEQERINAGVLLVNAANAQPDPLAKLHAFTSYTRNNQNIKLECKRINSYDEQTQNYFFDLTKRNMKEMYVTSEWGWNDDEKRSEMMEESAWYLVGRENGGSMVGFCHFRFDMDHDDPVLYCYEIQIEPSYRNFGLGRFFLQVMELMAFQANLDKVILTVFKSNKGAIRFFNRNGYTLDETSPEDNLLESFHYQILSKFRKKKI